MHKINLYLSTLARELNINCQYVFVYPFDVSTWISILPSAVYVHWTSSSCPYVPNIYKEWISIEDPVQLLLFSMLRTNALHLQGALQLWITPSYTDSYSIFMEYRLVRN